MLQMPFLELYHVYIYYMTLHIHFGGKIPPTAKVVGLYNQKWFTLTQYPIFHAIWAIFAQSRAHAYGIFWVCKIVYMNVWKMFLKYWDMIPSLNGLLGLPQEQRSCLIKCTICIVILFVMQLQKWMHMRCKKQVRCSHTWVKDPCKVWGHQSGVM